MAYDRCVAVCRPLHCAVTMHGGLCLGLAAGCLLAGFMNSLMQTVIFQLPLCHKVVHHFACEMLAVLRLTCVDISFNKVMVAISGFLVIDHASLFSCSVLLWSYSCCDSVSSFCPGTPQSIWDLRLSPHCGFHVLWNSHLHILETHGWLLSRTGEDGHPVLCCGDPNAESLNLQLEQGSDEHL